ncbi:protein of unknown function [Methylacidimicrobium sp. AP8]|uniref:ABC-type transport auxiliary lipoprotein family protein n=1 Tax=Methylacidimicrobium sp. AP8 TaxID=2730359 RepID=UPI0018C18EEE|nr:ABC-type transport auxiliary lipoprotein family protein [Methylacidimicrobium sp. AP8]CAB4242822.1 protein of unknown function [Methylacidimicrobium sp. AP8]
MRGRTAAARPLFLLWLCLPLFGCMSRPARLPSESFAFSPATGFPAKQDASRPVLVLRSVRVAPAFSGEDFVYRAADYRYERDPYAHFLSAPDLLIRTAISDRLQASGLFRAVVGAGSAVMTRSFADVSVRQLYGDFRPGRQPEAVIALRFLVTQVPPGTPLWEQTIVRRVPIRERSPSALMQGWNAGLQQILAEAGPLLVQYVRTADESAPASAEKAGGVSGLKPSPPSTPAPEAPAERRPPPAG